MEWDIPRSICQGQEIKYKGCMHDRLQCFQALVLGDRYIWHRLGVGLLQMCEGMNCRHEEVPTNVALHQIEFASKSLPSTEWYYSNIEREALGILQRLVKIHHYCLTREVHVVTDYRL